jgi:hypothetical protein
MAAFANYVLKPDRQDTAPDQTFDTGDRHHFWRNEALESDAQLVSRHPLPLVVA